MCCTTEDIGSKFKFNAELHNALMVSEDEKKVIELCRKAPDHALHIITIHDDTVLHMASFSKKTKLVLDLLDELPDHCLDKMTRQNDAGSTILHNTATSNHSLRVAEKVLKKAPGLLGMRNNNGETALFYSARFGKTEIFNFLAGKISAYSQVSKQPFLQRSDKTTALHISILFQHYELAFQIANDYKFLISEQDADGMTSLQLLSFNPQAFKRKLEDGFLSKLINSVKFSCSSSWKEKFQKEDRRYESAIELARLLIRSDTSWELTCPIQDLSKPLIHRYGATNNASFDDKLPIRRLGDRNIPLFIATKQGCVHIVKEILKAYPQAIGYVNDNGRNILYLAIKFRQIEIFELLKGMGIVKRRLARKIDNEGNTILHMVGKKRKDYVPEKVEGPALVLQGELLWYERVKEVMSPQFLNHQNNEKSTAEALFAETYDGLRLVSKEWLKRTAEGCSVVAVLIATVAFAAAYTVPGGANQSTGVPILVNHPLFVVFTVADVLSLTFSLAAVVTFLSILTSPFRFKDFKQSLPNKLMVGFTFMFLSVCLMMIAFSATILLMIKSKENWAKVMLYAASFVPVGIFSLSYFPLYIRKSLTTACKYLNLKTRQLIPRNLLAPLKKIPCLSDTSNARTNTSSFIP